MVASSCWITDSSAAMRKSTEKLRLRVGRQMKQLRLLRGLSQEQLAEKVGITSKHLGQMERGKANISIDMLDVVAASLAVDAGELFGATSNDGAGAATYVITQHDLDQVEQALRVVERVKRVRARRGTARSD